MEHKEKGNALYKNGEFQAALEEFSKAIEVDPTNAVYHANKAAVLSSMSRFSEVGLVIK